MTRKTKKDVEAVSSSSNREKALDLNEFVPRAYEVRGTGRNAERIKPVLVEETVVRSFDSDPLYSALLEVCIERGYFRIRSAQHNGGC